MGDKKGKEEESDEDYRVAFIREYMMKSMRLKPDKWLKMLNTQELRDVLMLFLNESYQERLIFTFNAAGQLIPELDFPPKMFGKACYFVRRKIPTTIYEDNINTVLAYGDLLPQLLESFNILFDNVIYPILNNAQNQEGWTTVIQGVMIIEAQKLRNSIIEIRGNRIGKTYFPLPIRIAEVMEMTPQIAAGNLTRLTSDIEDSLEAIVVKWLAQTYEFIKQKAIDKVFEAAETHPLPSNLYNFWNDRLENAEYLIEQIGDIRYKSIGYILEKCGSVFVTTYKSIVRHIMKAYTEAYDITLYLLPLRKITDKMEGMDLHDCKETIRQMCLVICLVWGNTKYFCKVNHMSLLFRLIHNMLIENATKTLAPDNILLGEIDESYNAVKSAIEVLDYYRQTYEECKKKLGRFSATSPVKPQDWRWHPEEIFDRFDLFMQRLYELRDMFEMGMEFLRLDRIEFSGQRGRQISAAVKGILEEFNALQQKWNYFTDNPLDPDPGKTEFVKAKDEYLKQLDVLKRKCGHQLEMAFDDSVELFLRIQLIQLTGSLLHMSAIKKQIDEGIAKVVVQFADEMDEVKINFDEFLKKYREFGLDGMKPDKHLPKVSGALSWLHRLRRRIIDPYEEFPYMELPKLFSNEYGRDVLERYQEMLKYFSQLENEIFSKWLEDVIADIVKGMAKPILFMERQRLAVNFDRELKIALHEMRTLSNLNYQMTGEVLENFYNKQDELWDLRVKVGRIAEWYNKTLDETHISEFKLVEDELRAIDDQLIPATTEHTWNSYDKEYVETVYGVMKDLWFRIKRSQDNVKAIKDKIESWGEEPLYYRLEHNPKGLLNIKQRRELMEARIFQAIETLELIKATMWINIKLLNNIPLDELDELPLGQHINLESDDLTDEIKEQYRQLLEEPRDINEIKESLPVERRPLFRAYEEYVDSVISKKLLKAVFRSLKYIRTEMGTDFPLFEIKMELQPPHVVLIPAIDSRERNNFKDIMDGILSDIYDQADMIPRIAQPILKEGANLVIIDENAAFMDDVQKSEEITSLRKDILMKVGFVLNHIKQHVKTYLNYYDIWEKDKKQYLADIKMYSRPLKDFEREHLYAIEKKEATLAEYKRQLDKFNNLLEEIYKWEDEKIFGFVYLNQRAFKYAVINEVQRWIALFRNDLIHRVLHALQELEHFINKANTILAKELDQDDFQGLLEVLSILNTINEKAAIYDNMFDPLREVVELLKNYNYEFSPAVYQQFSELPDKWLALKKTAAIKRQAVANIQSYQMELIAKRITLFQHKLTIFRNRFSDQAFFKVPCPNVYELLDKVNEDLLLLEDSCTHLTDTAKLFDMAAPDNTKIGRTRKEMKLIKQLWDFVFVIESTIENWKKTSWKKIDIEEMENECKKLTKDLRLLDKEVRKWEPFAYAEALMKNLVTSLRAVTELQNPAIRDRHWIELMQQTHVKFQMDDSTTLADLLDLNLHKYEEDVKNIVDKSVKEMAMEKLLKEVSAVWNSMQFETETHDRTHLKVLKPSEEMIETLEDHQVQLQNMLTSKYIKHFLDEVSDWQRKLSNADQVITSWFEVQRKWMYLESIFIGSADIRRQLPEDSRRFDFIDREFKALLGAMVHDRNVITATNKPGIYERLENLSQLLILCEKSLNEYLETKRLAYPRFYFVSSADLLDILSNGNKPLMVARHLTKLYDCMAKLNIAGDSKVAKGMIAKTFGEYVPFQGLCDCSGPVEIWLNRVTDKMREALRDHLKRAITVYTDKPRHVWVFDWQAQPALVGTQIWWTTETTDAFAKLDLGYENAMKDYNKKQINQLNNLISLLLGDLTADERQKIMTICTIDVHSRDVVGKMIQMKVDSSNAFQWQSQCRHRWDDKFSDCFANICDAQFRYDYEYLGNTPRLVITPLTDRCYITLTQSLHLIMGGAPAGPAGTGKTETTKDLGRNLGMMVYVFNCSEQMDYKSVGNIHKGLAQTGAWGCFDEFNRIAVEVLSVVAVQVKCIQDAIKGKKVTFNFLGEIISLRPTCGVFITMNPGYAGRTELPENLKALYRPCAMVVPDFALICEIMLVAEGFQEARLLARKFITLYTLCKELLSKQDHYDWGLRAIKSVLVVAGALRRGDKLRPEDQVLMRALRDFNIPKIVTDDVPVFMGLIGDLFPALDVPRKRDMAFEGVVKQSAIDLKLQPEDGFILKVVQLEELLEVRHSVYIVGNAGTGKTEVWKTLNKTYANQKRKPIYNDLNPKAVTNDELFGVVNPATREWRDGLIAVIMRDQANMSSTGPKWIVLDGDIDPMWIESLNTVMDDNKVLTLASNERIALTAEMRLLFEVSHLRAATPATVSRAGILYINPQDLGWGPFVYSWINRRKSSSEVAILTSLFEKYIPSLLEVFKARLKRITPISDMAMIQMTCFLLDCFLTPHNVPPDCPKNWYEIYFVFAIVWGFGSTLFQDQIIDWRNEFHKWWINEFKTIKFPSGGNVFSFYVDHETKKFEPWENLVPNFELDPDLPLQENLVHTSETTRLRYFVDMLIESEHPVMLIGPAGSGKTAILKAKLNDLPDKYAITNVPFNFYTTSEMLQRILEKPLEKKAGRNYGPVGNKTMIYFVDDMNMPEVDTYGTVQPHTLIRQFMDYRHWYDRQKLSLKDIYQCQFVSCMNPTAGSFTINSRLQRHFCSFAVNAPSPDALFHILHSILSQHLAFPQLKFTADVQKLCQPLVKTAIDLHQKMCSNFLPTAIKFHYNFNLRDIANIFTGILYANFQTCPNANSLLRLWVHECMRVYGDKLVDKTDISTFNRLIRDIVKKGIESFDEDFVYEEPLIYCHFAKGLGDPKYMPIKDWDKLISLLDEAQSGYNDLVGAMNLVLFEDAMAHVCRISRIIESSRGYALLIGVGGSGKQSLTRLASFISSMDVFQIQLTKDYTIADLKINISGLYTKAGLKGTQNCFLMTDAEVAKEEFLVVINDLLASGDIPELFPDDEVENIIGGIRNEVKQAGIFDSRENCWKYFIDKARSYLKVVLCFSPVGSTLRIRARKFPAIVNCTTIDWFHEWPQEALESVSYRFLQDNEYLPPELPFPISKFMAYVHQTVNDISRVYLQNDKRYNYTTPKSFLELIALYSKVLREKVTENKERIFRLESGLVKLKSCSEEVDALQYVLKDQEVVLKAKNDAADRLIVIVSAENEKVQTERNIAAEEETKVRAIEEDITVREKVCQEDYNKAEPALKAAEAALNTLNKNNLTELKSFGAPPTAVVNVCAAVLVLFSKGKIPKDRSWRACKGIMGRVDKFLTDLITYDKEHIHPDIIKELIPYLKDPEFDPEKIIAKSAAAAGLCAWVINIYKFYEVFLVVEPKLRALITAQTELKAARDKLEYLNNRLQELEEQLAVIQAEFDAALMEKQKCQEEVEKTAFTIDIASRLINGLASEKVRWIESVKSLGDGLVTLPGDMLLISCFISYVGCFTGAYRIELNRKWLKEFKTLDPPVPASENADPFKMICDDAQIAEWNNQGLPNDRMSAENGAILTLCERYPLIIDPQLQGIKWIKNKYGKDLVVTRSTQKGYIDVIERAVSNGNTLLLENIGESIDAVLNPLLGRMLIKKGTCLMIGDKEIDFNPKFRLILHTKLANPHYKPEMQAQATLINFSVTREGLEDQLLADVVKAERPDLETIRAKLTMQQNTFKITLKFLEDDLLQRLSSAGENVLEDVTLVVNLEKTKKTAEEIAVKVVEAQHTSRQIDAIRELYRPASIRAAIIYFILSDLFKINPMYQFSLLAFKIVFARAIQKAEPSDNVTSRVINLMDSITFQSYMYTARGLFEKDKLIFLTQMTIQIFLNSGDIDPTVLDFLLRYPATPNITSPVSFLSNLSWGGIKALSQLDYFKELDKDIENAPKRWEKITQSETPELEKLPGEWKTKTPLQRLCIMRGLRPDRMTYAVRHFIEERLGAKYVETRMLDFSKTFEETTNNITVFFILSAGVDPLLDVEKVGKALGFSSDNNNFHNVSLGQGQEIVAEEAIDIASKMGHWVMLQNIHLVQKWLGSLEKKMESTLDISHKDYRLFVSADPPSSPDVHIIPQGILESAIKIINEPPSGMLANLHKALDNFDQDSLEQCTKETEFKSILFALCYFHAVIAERRKFGPQGWNRVYPFNVGDLLISSYVLYNYLENNTRVPWEDLRYLFGEIMYGGHITDDWDRRLCRTYLEVYMQPELIDGAIEFCSGFPAPANTDYVGYHLYIDEQLPGESPHLYGLHLNAEIGFQTSVSETLFRTVFELQPRLASSGGAEETSPEAVVRNIVEDTLDKLPQPFSIYELMARVEVRDPYITVAFQECERMNMLMGAIGRSLKEAELGLKGELTITSDMEALMDDLYMDKVPDNWTKLAYPSTLALQAWFSDLLLRLRELEGWVTDFRLPATIWLGGFFNPQSFLTAIMQQTARKNEWPLDRMCLNCEVTKKVKMEITSAPREGAYVAGLFMEGARWDTNLGSIGDSNLKELYPEMPVIFIKAITQDKQDTKNMYECPVYKIRMRGPTFVWTFNLRTKERASKWTLAGVCLLLQT